MNITIGQFYPVHSKIHELDPRTKLAGTLIFIIVLFFASNIWGYLLAAIALALVIKLSNVPPKYMFKGIRGILFIILFTVVLNIFFTPGEKILFTLWKLPVYLEGVAMAVMMGTRLVMLVAGSAVLTLTTSPIDLTAGIERAFSPFKKIGVPAHEIAMIMSIALRFIPTLMEEVERITKAQTARGADFDTGNLMQKAKSMIPLLVPLFISAFHRADDLSLAMEARCYRGDINRTRMKKMVYGNRDYIFYGCLLLFGAAMAFTRFLPSGFAILNI